MTKLLDFPDMGVALYVTFDRSAQVYEVWADANCHEWVGCADTFIEARQVGLDYCNELMS